MAFPIHLHLFVVALSLLLLHRTSAETGDICFWGRVGYNSPLNGLYTLKGSYLGHPSYKIEDRFDKSCEPYYLYYTGEFWHLHTEKGSDDANAYCPYEDLLNCSHSWHIYNGSTFEKDPNIYITPDACPTWECDSIYIPGLPHNCSGRFELAMGDNTWFDPDTHMYWYFNPFHFQWVCDHVYTTECDETFDVMSEMGWTDQQNGERAQFQMESLNMKTFTIECGTVKDTATLDIQSATDGESSGAPSGFWRVIIIVVVILSLWALCTTVVLVSMMYNGRSDANEYRPLKLTTTVVDYATPGGPGKDRETPGMADVY